MTERIVASAINLDWMIIVWKRHSDCIASLENSLQVLDISTITQDEQWFYTSEHRRVNRNDAYFIALEYWQIDDKNTDPFLYSEDLR